MVTATNFYCARAIQPGPIGGCIWTAQGAAPAWKGDAVVQNGEVAGAVQAVVAHPTDANILWAGAVNGGIWRTTNALATNINWTPLTDFMPSLGVSSLDLDPTDPTYRTLVAGLGGTSSLGLEGPNVHGLLRSIDGGDSWSYLDGQGLFPDKDISGVLERGRVILVAVDDDSWPNSRLSTFGIYRSVDSGMSFTQLSAPTGQPYGLPYGRSISLVGEPGNPAVLYTALVGHSTWDSQPNGGTNGVYISTDTGATWSKISNAAMDALLATCGSAVRLGAAPGGFLGAAILDSNANGIAHAFWSNNRGVNWVDLGLSQANNDTLFGQPYAYYGLNIGAFFLDPGDPNYVYVARGWSMRCDLSQTSTNRWARFSGPISAAPPNSGTADSTSPHGDDRGMILDAAGNLLLIADGGIYRRTDPRSNSGSWSSINGNLQVSEVHDVAYDPMFHVVMAATQDNGTQRQVAPGQLRSEVIENSDGGDVAVSPSSLPGGSLVYSSIQNFGNFTRSTFLSVLPSATNVQPALAVVGGSAPLQGNFVTPIKLNASDPNRLVIGAYNGIYESFDRGDTITEIGPGLRAGLYGHNGNGLAYGSPDNPDVLYAITPAGVFVRTNGTGGLSPTQSPFPGQAVVSLDIALLPADWRTIFAIDLASVFMSTNSGASWTNITGNLADVGFLRCVRAFSDDQTPRLLVGTDRGVYMSSAPELGFWSKIGTNLPNAPVFDMEYNQADNVLVVGTLGRGSWLVTNADALMAPSPPSVELQPESQSVLIDSTAAFSAAVGGTPPFAYQWRKNGLPVQGATNSSFAVSLVQPGDSVGYDVIVSNNYGFATSALATLSVTGSPPANCAVCAPSGLISWWTGDGSASDRVGLNHGLLHNGVGFAPGEVREAFAFDGVDDFISVPYAPDWAFGANAFTLEMWASFSGISGSPALVACDAGGGPLNKWIFWLNGGVLQLHVNGGTPTYISSAPFTPTEGQWYHLVLTRNGNNFTFFVNGSVYSSIVSSVSIPAANAPLSIGNAEGNFFFDGMLDEVRIYNRALSASEIQAIYQAGTNGMCLPSPLMFTGLPRYSRANGFVLNAALRSGQSYRIQASTNLTASNWTTLTTFTAGTTPVFSFTNSSATNLLEQFYRIVSP